MGKDQELLEAARNGNFSSVEKIIISKTKRSGPLASLRRGPGANVQDASGYSALHHAALNGHKKIVELLLTNEASANIVDVKGSSPLHLAAWSGNVDVVRVLLSHGPSIPNVNLLTKDNETALHCAAQYGHTEVVCLLLEFSCDPTIRNTKQETALDLAAQYGRLETVEMLVRTHPELIQPYNGPSTLNFIFPHTPLHLASRNGHKAVVEMLLARGINVNVRTSSGTALHEAALCGKTEVVRTLLENGIDLNIRDSQNNTVVDLLKQFPCHVDIYSIVKKYHRAMYNERDDLFLPSSSPFDNPSYSIDSASLTSVSPMHYEPYERRLSSSCSISAASDTQHNRYTNYNQTGLSASFMDTNYLQDDMFSRSQDFDSVSVCSTASSSCSRDRRSPFMHTGIGGQLPSPGSISNKISPTPPKKPPRRNLSISPTHAMSNMPLSSEQNGYDTYEYAFIKINNSQDQIDFNESQEYSNSKRKSRDIETETEEELLLLVFPGTTYDATSNGSLSSSISLSDKSVSTDNNTVEEYVGDVPFAGLFKGSVTPDSETGPHHGKLERPTSLRQLKTVYSPNEHMPNGCSNGHKNDYAINSSPSGTNATTTNSVTTNGTDKSISMSILSPFDEQEEWAKISEIMASFKNSIDHKSIVTELEQEFESRLGFTRFDSNNDSTSISSYTSIGQWLQSLEFADLENAFVNFGYDDINFINGVINDCDLKEIGIMNENDRETILKQCTTLPNRVGDFWAVCKARSTTENNVKDLVKDWLDSINLGIYLETFRKNLYTDMEKIKRIWEVELTAFLDISKPGHRRRILASVSEGKSQCVQQSNSDLSVSVNLEDVKADLEQLKSNIQEDLEEGIRSKHRTPVTTSTISHSNNNTINHLVEGSGTYRHRKKSRPAPPPPTASHIEPDLEIRNPSELLVGVPATLKAQWRHKPSILVTGTVNYIASYLGSTVVKELRGTESTKKSIQKLKKPTSVVDCRTTPEIILAISYRGVKFLQVSDHSFICEHEIRNIHCACQDSEDLTHFAYITKDRDSKTHYCHVFCVQTMDLATEVILTLGEAFEVAYQMALKEHSASTCNGHKRSHSATSINFNSSQANSLKKNFVRSPNHINSSKASDLAKLFVRNKDGHLPLCTMVKEGRFREVKKLFDIENASDVKILKRIVLSIGNKIFRDNYHVEKEIADEVFVNVINELNYRSENTTQLSKYYHLSYPSLTNSLRNSEICSRSPNVDVKPEINEFDRYFVRDKDKRIPLWMMLMEEKYQEIKRIFNVETLNDTEMLKRIALDVGNKIFRETHRIEKDIADEIFECTADEIMVREGTMTQLLEYYNNSYN